MGSLFDIYNLLIHPILVIYFPKPPLTKHMHLKKKKRPHNQIIGPPLVRSLQHGHKQKKINLARLGYFEL